MRRLMGVSMLVLAFAVNACGSAGSRAASDARAAAENARAVRHRDAVARLAFARETAADNHARAAWCERAAGDVVAALNALDHRVGPSRGRGLGLGDYRRRVAGARVAYDGVGFSANAGADADGVDCFRAVGRPAGKALDAYTSAYRTWNGCAATQSCGDTAVKRTLRRRWTTASFQVTQAQSGLSLLTRRATNANNRVARLTVMAQQTAPTAKPST